MTGMTSILSRRNVDGDDGGLRTEGGLSLVLEHASNTEMESRGRDDRHRSEREVVPNLVHQAEQPTEDRARAPSKTDSGKRQMPPHMMVLMPLEACQG